jgi:hypothetical protein
MFYLILMIVGAGSSNAVTLPQTFATKEICEHVGDLAYAHNMFAQMAKHEVVLKGFVCINGDPAQ